MRDGQTLLGFDAKNIDAAAGEIVRFLEDPTKGNVMYLLGWHGLGASAALKVVAKRLKSSSSGMMDGPRSKLFDKVIHVDCSVWKSRRALQKAVAEELELPQWVMAIFDRHDEDDDFNGVDQGSRGEIPEVTREIFTNLAGHRFVVVFHNGSKSYIDLNSCGLPVYAYLRNRVLWTDRGRFHPLGATASTESAVLMGTTAVYTKEFDELMGSTDVVLCPTLGVWEFHDMYNAFWDLVHEEAKEVAEYTGMPDCIDHMIVEECILYVWSLRAMGSIDWKTNASNYWVCDGIIQGDTSAWEIGDALRSYIHLDCNWKQIDHDIPPSTALLQRDVPRQPPICQSSSSSNFTSLPREATSVFIEGTGEADTVLVAAAMFQHPDSSKQLRVLHLSFCTFSFASPPFLCCRNLRFLLLHHCKDNINSVEEKDQSHSLSGSWRACFVKLWVLDLSYTYLYRLLSEEMINIMADLRELNVKGLKQWHITDLYGSVTNLVKLRVTSDSGPVHAEDDNDTNSQAAFPNLSSADKLKTIILDGCVELEQIKPDILLPSLESFSFLNNDADATKISSISLRGCSQLKSVLLRGHLGSLEGLDLSDTAVKTLDLREVEVPNLRRLILLGCEKLRAILWPPEDKRPKSLEVLRVDTNPSASSAQFYWEGKTMEASVAGIHRAASLFDSNWYISVRDARLLRSVAVVEEYIKRKYVYMEIDSSPLSRVVVARGISGLQQPNKYLDAKDAIFGGYPVLLQMWDCPPSPTPNSKDWHYVHIQDEEEMKSGLLQQEETNIEGTSGTSVALPPVLICDNVRILHVHDSLSITSIGSSWPEGSAWSFLKWCRVERCPKLHTVFAAPQRGHSRYRQTFQTLETFWASHLPALHYIWRWGGIFKPGLHSFEGLVFLHLDYCPRLIHVLPLSEPMTTLPRLMTLEIICCGDLREVFPFDPEYPGQRKTMGFSFPRLRHIHLHELPTLHHICGYPLMSTPMLETVKIRGCWSLKRLPVISGNTKPPKVDCEKEWWDKLEWDGVVANHHPSLYEAHHSVYHKKGQLQRGTPLR